MEDLPTELGRTMRKWRNQRGFTSLRAGQEIGVSKSTWSDLENGKRLISMETAKGLSIATGISLDEISRQGGMPIRHSKNSIERLERASAAAEVIPGLGLLLDLFPELTPDEADMLLTLAETLVERRRRGPG